MLDLAEFLHSGVEQLNLELPAQAEATILDYVELLNKWNQIHNLTAIHDQKAILIRHIFDSLAILPFIVGVVRSEISKTGPHGQAVGRCDVGQVVEGRRDIDQAMVGGQQQQSRSVAPSPGIDRGGDRGVQEHQKTPDCNTPIIGFDILDFGSGAGIPGVPLALALPEWQFVLIDSSSKKTTFLNHVILSLKLKNIKVINQRVEKFRFDLGFATIVTRATDTTEMVIAKTNHLCKESGQILMMKGKKTQEPQPLGKTLEIHPIRVPYLNESRHLVKILNKRD